LPYHLHSPKKLSCIKKMAAPTQTCWSSLGAVTYALVYSKVTASIHLCTYIAYLIIIHPFCDQGHTAWMAGRCAAYTLRSAETQQIWISQQRRVFSSSIPTHALACIKRPHLAIHAQVAVCVCGGLCSPAKLVFVLLAAACVAGCVRVHPLPPWLPWSRGRCCSHAANVTLSTAKLINALTLILDRRQFKTLNGGGVLCCWAVSSVLVGRFRTRCSLPYTAFTCMQCREGHQAMAYPDPWRQASPKERGWRAYQAAAIRGQA
jgi:hypothetical protein